MLPFVPYSAFLTNADSYMILHFKDNKSPFISTLSIKHKPVINQLLTFDKFKLLYHVNWLITIHRLCILPLIAPDILTIAHKKGYSGFVYCYKIIAYFSFIYNLTKLFHSFIYPCLQYLALQTNYYPCYKLLQPIELLLLAFLILTLDFVLVLLLTRKKFNTILSVIYEFSKPVIFIDITDTCLVEEWAHIFLKGLI